MDLDREFNRIHDGRAAQAAWNLLEEDLAEAQKNLDLVMFNKLERNQTITPEEALQFIHKKYASWHLVRMLVQKMKTAESAGERLKPFMDGEVING